jgi:hypothetical protein
MDLGLQPLRPAREGRTLLSVAFDVALSSRAKRDAHEGHVMRS